MSDTLLTIEKTKQAHSYIPSSNYQTNLQSSKNVTHNQQVYVLAPSTPSHTRFMLSINKHAAEKVQQSVMNKKTTRDKCGKILGFNHFIRNLKYVPTTTQTML